MSSTKNPTGFSGGSVKTSDKLYNINANISLYCIAMKKPIEGINARNLNKQLGIIIKEIRGLENE